MPITARLWLHLILVFNIAVSSILNTGNYILCLKYKVNRKIRKIMAAPDRLYVSDMSRSSLDSLPATKTNRMTVMRTQVEDIRGTSSCLRGDFWAVWCSLQVPCDCAFMWHFNYCRRFLLITLFTPTAHDVLTPVTRCLLRRWKQTCFFFFSFSFFSFFCSVNKCNCLLLCACPGDLASYFNANSFALCINDRLNAISKTYHGTVGSLW